MKMISRTRVMSTSGVTLMLTIIGPGSSSPLPKLLARGMSASAPASFRARSVGSRRRRDRREHQVGHGVDLRHRLSDSTLEDVEGDDGGDGHEEADGGRHQRLGDAGHDGA